MGKEKEELIGWEFCLSLPSEKSSIPGVRDGDGRSKAQKKFGDTGMVDAKRLGLCHTFTNNGGGVGEE